MNKLQVSLLCLFGTFILTSIYYERDSKTIIENFVHKYTPANEQVNAVDSKRKQKTLHYETEELPFKNYLKKISMEKNESRNIYSYDVPKSPLLTKKVKKFVYVDLGARNGDTIDWYLKKYPNRSPSVIWAFEANPQHFQHMDTYAIKHDFLDLRIIKKAAWIHSKGVQFSLDRSPLLDGGSIFKKKTKYMHDAKWITVPSVDFSAWLLDNTNSSDDIILKMDVEGAEYDILDRMITDKSIERVNTLIVEWHDRFMPGRNHTEFEKNFRDLKIKYIRWH